MYGRKSIHGFLIELKNVFRDFERSCKISFEEVYDSCKKHKKGGFYNSVNNWHEIESVSKTGIDNSNRL